MLFLRYFMANNHFKTLLSALSLLLLKLQDAQCRITTNKPQCTLFVATLGQNNAILGPK